MKKYSIYNTPKVCTKEMMVYIYKLTGVKILNRNKGCTGEENDRYTLKKKTKIKVSNVQREKIAQMEKAIDNVRRNQQDT